jgi:predicted RNA binding protein YcfA (HicA-like mRNA interferase family)
LLKCGGTKLGKRGKLIYKIISGVYDNNILFDEMCNLLYYFGFSLRVKGSHYIFYKDDIEEIINIQSMNGKIKMYQVKHIRDIIIKYNLGGSLDV